jgi:hypothetical protein
MHALDQVAHATSNPVFDEWALELATTAHRAFARRSDDGRLRMIWKASIDLSRAAVATMGQHDPLDGFVTCLQLRRALASHSADALERAIVDFASMVNTRALATTDPLGIGGLLVDAARLQQLSTGEDRDGERLLCDAIVDAASHGLSSFVRSPERDLPAAQRLAFRELGLTIGLAAVERMLDRLPRGVQAPGATELLARFGFLRAEIESFWLRPESRSTRTWTDHVDINDVMLATSLLPEGFLGLDTHGGGPGAS